MNEANPQDLKAAGGGDDETELESVSELDEEVEEIIEEGVERDDSRPMLYLCAHGDVTPSPVRL